MSRNEVSLSQLDDAGHYQPANTEAVRFSIQPRAQYTVDQWNNVVLVRWLIRGGYGCGGGGGPGACTASRVKIIPAER